MIGIDTNVLVRYFAQDDPLQGQLAKRFMERRITSEQPGFISLVVLAELTWVLRSRYKATRVELIQVVEQLLAHEHLEVQEANAVWLALDEYDQSGADFADALIAALGVRRGCQQTVTFDAKATRITGMELLV